MVKYVNVKWLFRESDSRVRVDEAPRQVSLFQGRSDGDCKKLVGNLSRSHYVYMLSESSGCLHFPLILRAIDYAGLKIADRNSRWLDEV